jgi:septal ring-binding cell division protein DamX
MEESNKVYVFEKKELFLVFLFVFILGIICFTLGVKLGKKLSLESSGVTKEDQLAIDLKSDVEESAEIESPQEKLSDEEKLKELMNESKDKLNQEIKESASESNIPKPNIVPEEVPTQKTESSKQEISKTSYDDKYTIQLGSYSTIDEAKQFAEGFSVRGYNPIVNEVVIEGKGIWYRVSLGVFETVQEAKNYIKKEQTLFQNQNFVISEIK